MARTILVIAVLVAGGVGGPGDRHQPRPGCSSFVLRNGETVVFGANLDHVSVSDGQVFVNPRGLEKTSLHAGTTGAHLRWVSRYASVTFNLVGYQLAWAGMNEEGLTLSTMSLDETEQPGPDPRPPLDSGEWIQFVLDTCATVAEVTATVELVRIFTVDHYLVADRWGNVASVEFLDGEMVVHTGAAMPVAALTNSPYGESASTWLRLRESGYYAWLGGSLHRFCLAADRVAAFAPTDPEAAVAHAFDTLELVRGQRFSVHTSQWSLVFDTADLRAFFRTFDHPAIRWLDLDDLDPVCTHPVQMLDIQQPLGGDVSGRLFDYSSDLAYQQLRRFLDAWGVSISDRDLRRMLDHLESFPCLLRRPRRPGGRAGPAPGAGPASVRRPG